VSGTYNLQLRLCPPTVSNASRATTLQVLVHGATYNTEYWDVGFEPEIYSYVRFAAARGYWTLNLARLGDGKSDRPDGISVVQDSFDVAVLAEIVKLARAGGVPGTPGDRGFNKIVFIGHSYGSIILNGVIAAESALVDAAIFTGYSHNRTSADAGALGGFGPAREINPQRFGDLEPSYVTSGNASQRTAAFYGPPGTFAPAALAWDEAHKDTVTNGELITQHVTAVVAPDFRGDAFTVNGANDFLFCTDDRCSNIAGEGSFYPAAKSAEFAVIPATGHSLNFQLSAPAFYNVIQSWLNRH
ncbi:alpha/beta-hydrolase, partial [Exidia glandulosa HHB12029]